MTVYLYDIITKRYISIDENITYHDLLVEIRAKRILALFHVDNGEEWLPIDTERDWRYLITYYDLKQQDESYVLPVKVEKGIPGLVVLVPHQHYGEKARILDDPEFFDNFEYDYDLATIPPCTETEAKSPMNFNDLFSLMLESNLQRY
jgi:hypothetical protein